MRKLSEYVPKLKAADYSTICKRLQKMDLDIALQDIGNDVILAVDSSGMKVSNRGEWIRHKWKVRRGWIKVHIAVDDVHTQVVGMNTTDETGHDSGEFGTLVDQSVAHVGTMKGRVVQVHADGAYDANENFRKLEEYGIQPAIKVRKPPPTASSKNPRKKYAKEFHGLGYEKWRDTYGYGKRWMDETAFSRAKREYGEYVIAKKWENMVNEIRFQYAMLNIVLNGINVYSAI